MRIRDRYSRAVSGASTGPSKARPAPTAPEAPRSNPPAADMIRLSGRGLEVQRARGFALQAPDVREGLVAEVSGQIEGGRYDVSGEDVAPKLIQEHLSEVVR